MKKLFEMIVSQEQDVNIGYTCDGETLLSPTGNGYFSGELLNGKVVPVGMGITYMSKPGQNDVEATFLLETDDNSQILLETKSILNIDPSKEKKLLAGEHISPEEYYYKGVAVFKTSYDKYKWLERKICICMVDIITWEKLKFEIYIV